MVSFNFGAPAPAPGVPAAAGGFSFGATAPAAAPAATGSTAPGGFNWGATAPPPTFGSAAPAPTSTATTSLFGPPATAPAPSAPLFGAPPAPAAPAAPAAAAPNAMSSVTLTKRQEAARLEALLLNLRHRYAPTVSAPGTLVGTTPHHAQQPNSQCAFHSVFYDPMTAEQRHSRLVHGPHHLPPRPAHVDARTWADAVAANPDPNEYIPVVVVGAEALAARLTVQKDRSTKLAGYMTQLREAEGVLRVQSAKSDDVLRAATAQHTRLRSRLLRLMRKVEVMRGLELPLQPAEREAAQRLRMQRGTLETISRSLAEVEERGRQHVHALRTMPPSASGSGMQGALSEQGSLDLQHLLQKQRDGLDELSAIVKRDVRDVQIVREEVEPAAPPGGAAAAAMGSRSMLGGLPGPAGAY